MKLPKLLLALSALGIMGAVFAAQQTQDPPAGQAMIAAANTFRKSLMPEQLKQCTFAFNDEERLNWHFIPRERKGLPLRDLEGAPLKTALAFIHSGLTEAGYDQTLRVMGLEEVLRLIEGAAEGAVREQVRERRDPGKYYLSIFGEPSDKGQWGWRLEGHHLSLNFTLADGKVVSSTPEFFGANPGTIDAGLKRQIRVLGAEEDIARQILKLCTPDQQTACWISKTAPEEVPGPNKPQAVVEAPVGLSYAKMSADQKKLLEELLKEYLKNLPASITAERRAEIEKAGLDQIHFAWWGQSELNEPHHYRVQGPTFVIEYNNTQNSANHVHSMWRSLKGDFALPRT